MSRKNLVSIIVPVYNAEKRLENCIESILNQTYENLELILVDDGSIDRSGDICDYYSSMDRRVNVLHQQNSGPSVARNNGIIKSQGHYIQFVDSDDTLEFDMVEKLVLAMKNDIQLVISGYKTLQKAEGKQIITEKIPSVLGVYQKELFLGNFGELYLKEFINSPWNKLYIREVLEALKLKFLPELKMGEDLLFNLGYINACSKINIISDALYIYDISPSGSLTGNYINNYYENQKKLFEEVRIFLIDNQKYSGENKKLVEIKYINSMIGSLNNLFHANANLTKLQIKKTIKIIISDYHLKNNLDTFNGNLQGRVIVKLIRHNYINGVYFFFKMKVLIQKKYLV